MHRQNRKTLDVKEVSKNGTSFVLGELDIFFLHFMTACVTLL